MVPTKRWWGVESMYCISLNKRLSSPLDQDWTVAKSLVGLIIPGLDSRLGLHETACFRLCLYTFDKQWNAIFWEYQFLRPDRSIAANERISKQVDDRNHINEFANTIHKNLHRVYILELQKEMYDCVLEDKHGGCVDLNCISPWNVACKTIGTSRHPWSQTLAPAQGHCQQCALDGFRWWPP